MILVRVKTEGIIDPRWGRRELNAVMAAALEEAGAHWHKYFRPEHFTERGAAKYGYAKRSLKYTRRKFFKYGHTRPLTWTGESEKLARTASIKATSRSVSVAMRTYSLNKGGTRGSKIDMQDELRRMTQDEVNELAIVMARVVVEKMKLSISSRANS